MKNVLIGGIGNVLLGDDGVGPYVARVLDAQYEFEGGVEIADLGTPALDLIDQISGRDAVLLIDSVGADAAPGTVVFYRKAEIMRHAPSVRMDPHSPALVDTLLAADLFAIAPRELLLIGVVAGEHKTGCQLSDAVNAALDQLIAGVLRELDRWGVQYTRREQAAPSSIWWNTGEKKLSSRI